METNQVWSKVKAEFIDQRQSRSFFSWQCIYTWCTSWQLSKRTLTQNNKKDKFWWFKEGASSITPHFFVLDLLSKTQPPAPPLTATLSRWLLGFGRRRKAARLKITPPESNKTNWTISSDFFKFKHDASQIETSTAKILTNQCWPWFFIATLSTTTSKKNGRRAWIEHCILDIQTNLEILHLSHQSQQSSQIHCDLTNVLSFWGEVTIGGKPRNLEK